MTLLLSNNVMCNLPLGLHSIQNKDDFIGRIMGYVPVISLISAPLDFAASALSASRSNRRDKALAIGLAVCMLARTLISMAGAGFLFAPFDLITDNIFQTNGKKHSVGKIALTTAVWTFTIAAIATTIALSIIFPPTSSVIIPGVVLAAVGTLLTAKAAV